jgi:hypothetical protein
MARRLPGLARSLSGGASRAIAARFRVPALKSAMPAEAGHEPALDADVQVDVMLTDGTWTRAAVRARRRDARGRRCVLLSWSPGPAADRREGWFVHDIERIRRARTARKARARPPAARRRTRGPYVDHDWVSVLTALCAAAEHRPSRRCDSPVSAPSAWE